MSCRRFACRPRGSWGRDVRDALCELTTAALKVELIQNELVRLLFANSRPNDLVDYCVRNLKATHGRLPIQDLERKTGFSRQHINPVSEARRPVS